MSLMPSKIPASDERQYIQQTQVVIVDDQAASRAVFSRVLVSLKSDIEVKCFSHPVPALEWIEDNHPALIITDFRMPQMDGVELVERLRANDATARIPIIVATIIDDRTIKRKALDAGATDFLTKPIDHDECRARCRNLLALSEYQSLLQEHIAVLSAQLCVAAAKSKDSINSVVRKPDTASHVAIEYRDLFALTSTVAAIDKLLGPIRTTIGDLECSTKLPLIGRKPSNL